MALVWLSMATRHPEGPKKKTKVTTRLYTADVRELKRRAATQDVPWQTLLRKVVRDALRVTNEGKVF